MIKINEMIDNAIKEGYQETDAEAKVCQDIILTLISKSPYNQNITIKGGVVMCLITKDTRRATQDIDLDFIKYSLKDDSIDRFILSLNAIGLVSLKRVGEIEELRQQDYHGKRVYIEIKDSENVTLKSKIDLGVHKHFNINQEVFCFNTDFDNKGANLLINSKEQMFTEKLRSILKFGAFSTRYKDIFDMHYLIQFLNADDLMTCLNTYIFKDDKMRENTVEDISKRLQQTFKNSRYISRLKTSNKNWLGVDINITLDNILNYFSKLTK